MTEPEAQYITDSYGFVLTPPEPEDEPGAPVHHCGGHCANHAREQEANEALLAAIQSNEEADRMEEIRLNMVDSLLIYANWTLREDPVWRSLTRAYHTAAGASLETCHG
jgi:hypothetical protein